MIKIKTIQFFGDAIRNVVVTMDIADNKQNHLGRKIGQFISNARPWNLNMKRNKEALQALNVFFSSILVVFYLTRPELITRVNKMKDKFLKQ